MAVNPRTCVGCRHSDDRLNLRRIAVQESILVVDERAVFPGRGAWIHPDSRCLSQAIRTRAFERSLRQQPLEYAPLTAWLESNETPVPQARGV